MTMNNVYGNTKYHNQRRGAKFQVHLAAFGFVGLLAFGSWTLEAYEGEHTPVALKIYLKPIT